jgi:glycosyltransferase involved in cell wall biosynthesis
MPSELYTYAVNFGDNQQFELKTVVDPAEAQQYFARIQGRTPQGHAHVVFHPPGWYDSDQKWVDFYQQRRDLMPNAGAHIGYTMFETDRIDANWATACNGMDEIWVPTEFNRQTFAASGVDPAKIHVVPLGLQFERYDPKRTRPLELAGKAGFNFLSVFEWNKRKGYDVLFRAYATEFTSDDDVALFVRTYGYTEAGRAAWGESELQEYFLSFCPDPARAPKLRFLLDKIPDGDMPSLYAACDSFVLPSRGEGWGLPYLEAMAMAKPTIGTRWSGQTAFMSDDNAYMLDIDGLTEIAHGDRDFSREYWGHRMAEPSIEHLRRLMRQVVKNPAAARQKGEYARHDVAQRWTRANAAERILVRKAALSRRGPSHSAGRDATAHVIWTSPLYDASGYADEARNFLIGLDQIGTDVRTDPVQWSNWKATLSADETRTLNRLAAVNVDHPYVRVEHFSPLNFVRDPGSKATVGRTMFETDGLPPDWVARCNELDEIWVPTDFNIQTFTSAGVQPNKLRKVPGSFNADLYRRELKPLDVGLDGRFVFLSVFDWIPRKGWDILLRGYLEEFGPEDNVTLLLKAYSADGSFDAQQLQDRLRRHISQELGYGDAPTADIKVIVATYAEEEMARLYRAADAYVTATRGEGWGRPIMEAMATGLPCIATGWGGNTEFMNTANSYLLDYSLEEIPESVVAGAPWCRGQRWAEPSVVHLRELMREVFEDPTAAAQRGAIGQAEVLERYDRPVVAKLVAEELDRLLGNKRPKAVPVAWEGSQFVHHSLAHINREACLGLIDSGQVDLSIIPYERHSFGAEVDSRFKAIQQRLVQTPATEPAVHVRQQWPPQFQAPESGAWVMIQPWEYGGLPAEWIAPMRDSVDEIWVHSNWVRDCYIKSGVPEEKVVVIPAGVKLDRYSPDGPAYPLRTRKKFKFLFVGGTVLRKGVDVLLETYLNTFTAADDVCLVIKAVGTKTAYSDVSLESEIERFRAMPNLPEIEYISKDMRDDEVASLYRAADALVHPYRGEGFGMPIAEAMASGLPVIVTGYGAALDFCNERSAYLIPAQVRPISDDESGLPTPSIGYWVAEPDRDAFARLMRQVIDHPEEAQRVGARGRERMRAYSWQTVAQRYLERIKVLAERTPCRFVPRVVEPMRLEGRRSTAFLHHPQWRSDAWQSVVSDYCRAFTADDDVTLVLLLDPDQGVSQDQVVERVSNLLNTQVKAPDVLLVPERVPDLACAYAAVDYLVPSGDATELETARKQGVRILSDLQPETWRAAA